MTAERLAEKFRGGGLKNHITLVAPNDKFTFYPALVRLAFGDCEPEDITFDMREKLNELNVRFVRGEAVNLNMKLKRARIASADFNGDISYDYLIIAPGRRLATEKIGGFFEHAHHLLGTKAALKFGEAVRNFEKGEIVVGLAPDAFLPIPVCETAIPLAAKFEEKIVSGEISITAVFPESIKGAFGGADLHEKLEKAFAKHRIKVMTNFAVKEISENSVLSGDGTSINYDLLMLLPPFRGQAFLAEHGITDEKDFVITDNFMRVQDLDKTYAVGDIAAFPGPKLAFMAVRQAFAAAENIASEIRGENPRKFYYHDIAVIIDEGGEDSIFLHYGVWDETLYGLKIGKMWSRMKNEHNQLWSAVR